MTLKVFILTWLYGFGSVAICVMGRTVGPDVEESLLPVISNQSVYALSRTPEMACWVWHYTKNRNVEMLKQELYVDRDNGIRFPVVEFRPDLNIPSNNSTTAKAGETRPVPKCVFIPSMMREQKHFVVEGGIRYKSWLWELYQPIMPVVFNFTEAESPPVDTTP